VGLQYAGWLPGANILWHAHEMVFGYAFAVIAGFLLTTGARGQRPDARSASWAAQGTHRAADRMHAGQQCLPY
jgi:hypothetical protein